MDFKTNEVYTFRLNSGEELVAKVVDVAGDRVFVTGPLILAVINTPQGPTGQLIPGMLSVKPTTRLEINTQCVVLCGVPTPELYESYIQSTTGIAPVTKKILTG